MSLLDLPMELFEMIIYHSIQVRGLKRGMRLRLVNKAFSQTVIHSLYRFKILDQLSTPDFGGLGFQNLPQLPPKMIQSYLEYRVMQEPPSGNPLLVCLRSITKEIYGEQYNRDSSSKTFQTYLQQICLMVLRFENYSPYSSRSHSFPYNLMEILQRTGDLWDEEYERRLLTAALCTNSVSVVERCKDLDIQLRDEGGDDTSDWRRYYLDVAAQYGNKRLLENLMIRKTGAVDTRIRAELFQSAAMMGQFETAVFLYNFRREQVPWDFTSRLTGNHECYALYRARFSHNLEVLKFIESFDEQFPKGVNETHMVKEDFLYDAVLNGSFDVAHYWVQKATRGEWQVHTPLFRSYPVQRRALRGCEYQDTNIDSIESFLGLVKYKTNMIKAAAAVGRTGFVRELLSRGFPIGDAIYEAAGGAYYEIINILLDAGAQIKEGVEYVSPLASAIKLEDVRLFNLFIAHGVDLHHPSTALACVGLAKKDGLESMLDLLEEHGVDVGRDTFPRISGPVRMIADQLENLKL